MRCAYAQKPIGARRHKTQDCARAFRPLNGGRRFVKELRRTQSGQWYLHSHNSEPIVGVVIEWAAKVRLIQRAQ